MPYIGQQPAPKVVTSSDLADDVVTADKIGDTAISGFTALGAEPADTDELLISDAGTLKRLDYSYIKGGGGLIHIKTQTISSGVSSVEFKNGVSDVVFDSTYKAYKLFVSNVKFETDGMKMHMRLSTDSGSSYLTGNYVFAGMSQDAGGTENIYRSGSDSDIRLFGDSGSNQADEPFNIELTFHDPASTTNHIGISFLSTGFDSSSNMCINYGGGSNTSTTSAINAFQIRPPSGNIETGTFTLFGVANS